MMDDGQLLQQYARERSESAFGEVVKRHIDLVYSTALRAVNGDRHLAQDVTQTVFIDLGRKAARLPRNIVLAGWLHRHTSFTAATAVRTERRRRNREQTAVEMRALDDNTDQPWEAIAPHLDDSLNQLSAADRDALVLRFLKQWDFRAVGAAFGISEDAAQKRVGRALERLRGVLSRCGVTLTATALTAALGTASATAAPAGLASSVTAASVATAAGTGTTLTLLKLMAVTSLKTGILGATILAGITACVVIQHQAQAKLSDQERSLAEQSGHLAQLTTENERLSNLLAQANAAGGHDFDDLLRLRREADSLRQQTNDLSSLQAENRRLQARIVEQLNGSKTLLRLREEAKASGIAKLNFCKDWVLAFRLFAEKNGDLFPTTFEQALAFLPNQSKTDTNLTADQFEIVYQGPVTNIPNPALVIVMREKRSVLSYSGGWTKGYGFVDGHSEIHFSKDGEFDEWEKQRILPPPSGQ